MLRTSIGSIPTSRAQRRPWRTLRSHPPPGFVYQISSTRGTITRVYVTFVLHRSSRGKGAEAGKKRWCEHGGAARKERHKRVGVGSRIDARTESLQVETGTKRKDQRRVGRLTTEHVLDPGWSIWTLCPTEMFSPPSERLREHELGDDF